MKSLPGARVLGPRLALAVWILGLTCVWLLFFQSSAQSGGWGNTSLPLVLVTGGAGYIGSHTIVELLQSGHRVLCIDNLVNSKEESLARVRRIVGPKLSPNLRFRFVEMRHWADVNAVFAAHPSIASVIHFAGLKAVGESVAKPLLYHENNLESSLNLLRAMQLHGVHVVVFSSSATVYGSPERLPITEDSPLSATNPYGRTKLFIEEIMRDAVKADPKLTTVLLRYFNPVGAHESGLIGEDPTGLPNNLMPFISKVAVGELPTLRVFGDDYDGTVDGTGMRDYIHVVDLARGHLAALSKAKPGAGALVYNLGTGRATSVLQLVEAFKRACACDVPVTVTERRPGDVAKVVADPALARKELGWTAELGLDRMCEDTWRWQSKNPKGYTTN